MLDPNTAFHFNGIRADNGRPLDLPRNTEEMLAWIRSAGTSNVAPSTLPSVTGWVTTLQWWIRALQRFNAGIWPPLGNRLERFLWDALSCPWMLRRMTSVTGRDGRPLSETGWGLVFPATMKLADQKAILEQLKPLVDLRTRQVSHPDLVQVYDGDRGVRACETGAAWVARMTRDQGRLPPWHLLLVGSPQEIPFQFQRDLVLDFAVGRLHFDELDGKPWPKPLEAYGRYARGVVEAETGKVLRERRVSILATRHHNDPATAATHDELARPLARRAPTPGWTVDAWLGAEATEERHRSLLGCVVARPLPQHRPALLVVAAHGVVMPRWTQQRLGNQGALVGAEWPGYEVMGADPEPIDDSMFVAADDLGGQASVQGLVAFHFACCGGGALALGERQPTTDSTPQGEPKVAPRDFVAALPQTLLGHWNGSALAVLSHVDLVWEFSYLSGTGRRQLFAHELLMDRLSDRHHIGDAARGFAARYLALSILGMGMKSWDELERALGKEALVKFWWNWYDASNFMILGDPASRLAVVPS